MKTWRYSLPATHLGWAIIFIDTEGCFAAVSDYGDVTYRWNPRGMVPGQDFREFLVRCDDGYLIDKFSHGRREYDAEKTLAEVKSLIRERLTPELAQYELETLNDHDNLESEFAFSRWLEETKLQDAAIDCSQSRPPREAVAFVKMVMPRLREVMKMELEADRLLKENG